MELPVLDKCCFIFDLKTGVIVMSGVNAILSLILSGLLLSFAVAYSEAYEQMKRDDLDSGISSVVYHLLTLMVALLISKFMMDLFYMYAVQRAKHMIMKKFAVLWVIFLVLYIIGFLKTMFTMDAGYVIAQILYLAYNLYFIMVVRSYMLSLQEEGVM